MAFLPPLFTALLFMFSGGSAHEFHVSHSRVAVDKADVVVRVRFFADDLNTSLAKAQNLPSYTNTKGIKPDSTFLAYFNSNFVLSTANNKVLQSTLLSSGEERDGDEAVWWYMIQYRATQPIETLHITNTLLLESFDDQKNIVQVQHFPSEKKWSLYFVEDKIDHSLNFSSK